MTQSYTLHFLYIVSLYVYQTHTSFPACSKDSPKSYELLCIKINTVHVSTRVWLARHSERWIPQNRCFKWLSCTLQRTLLEASVKDLYTSRSQDFSTTLVHTWHRSARCLCGRRILRHAQINSRDFSVGDSTVSTSGAAGRILTLVFPPLLTDVSLANYHAGLSSKVVLRCYCIRKHGSLDRSALYRTGRS